MTGWSTRGPIAVATRPGGAYQRSSTFDSKNGQKQPLTINFLRTAFALVAVVYDWQRQLLMNLRLYKEDLIVILDKLRRHSLYTFVRPHYVGQHTSVTIIWDIDPGRTI